MSLLFVLPSCGHSQISQQANRVQINSFFGQTQFQDRFGTLDVATGLKKITAPWQSGLANSALVGELAGLVINSFAMDRFGCRPTYLFFMAWMAVVIFIAVFAPSLPVLAFGEAMSGISWGVFQARTPFFDHRKFLLMGLDPHHVLCLRNCTYSPSSLRHSIRLSLLGRRYTPIIWRPSSSCWTQW